MNLITKLYWYQDNAANKLIKLKVGALFTEMGTGKTRIALELASRRLEARRIDRVLWLCPCSVKTNLANDIVKHTGEMPPEIEICGIETLSSSVSENVRLLQLVNDFSVFLIVDESSLVKNPNALRTTHITRLAEKCEYRLIANGTPISKNIADLFAQFYILDWRILGYRSFWSFSANHIKYDDRIPGKITRTLNVDYIIDRINPYTYQIKKSECMELPPKRYETASYHLDPEQMDHYEEIAAQFLMQVDELRPETIYRTFSALQAVISGMYVSEVRGHIHTRPIFKRDLDNPRIQCLLDIIPELSGKIIIFCKYTHEIQSIYELLNNIYGEESAVKFFGKLSQKKRQESIEKFKNKSRFFIANKACAGYGLNLQFCHQIIFYNNDWDYATRVQAEDRVHRIGQTENIDITDICAYNTLDMQIVNCLSRKEDLVGKFKSLLGSVQDKKNLKDWIYGGLEDEKNVSANKRI